MQVFPSVPNDYSLQEISDLKTQIAEMESEFAQRIRHVEKVYQTKLSEQRDEFKDELETVRNCKICIQQPNGAALSCGHVF